MNYYLFIGTFPCFIELPFAEVSRLTTKLKKIIQGRPDCWHILQTPFPDHYKFEYKRPENSDHDIAPWIPLDKKMTLGIEKEPDPVISFFIIIYFLVNYYQFIGRA